MGQIDWDKERKRLAKLYVGMEDGELEKTAVEAGSLTEVAREALRSEMSRRGMAPFPEITEPAVTSQPEPPRPVMIRRYRDLPEASIAKSILDSAGIESFLLDDNIVRLDWFYSNLVGGIKLLVRKEDAEAADKLLAQDVPAKSDVEGWEEHE